MLSGRAGQWILALLILWPKAPAAALEWQSPGVAYHPSGVPPERIGQLSAEYLRKDLEVLRRAGFKSLVTYSSQGVLAKVPALARELGFNGTIVMGVWDPLSSAEVRAAIEQSAHIDGYCIGNEGLGARYSDQILEGQLRNVRRSTGKPASTSEPIASYLQGSDANWLRENSDWLFPTAHPVHAHTVSPMAAVSWLVVHVDTLKGLVNKQVVLKEVGYPTGGGPDFSEVTQGLFFQVLEQSRLSFFHFEAFDQPWKADQSLKAMPFPSAEGYWGLFKTDRTPKRVMSWRFPPPRSY